MALPPPVSLRDDTEILRQEFSSCGVESRPARWARPHQQAFRTFGGTVDYVVLDKQYWG